MNKFGLYHTSTFERFPPLRLTHDIAAKLLLLHAFSLWGHSQRTSGWPRGRGSAESGRSIVIRVWFYCFIRTQGEGGLEILVLAGRPLWMAPNESLIYRHENRWPWVCVPNKRLPRTCLICPCKRKLYSEASCWYVIGRFGTDRG